jgi:multidrug efflux pump subunit AcrA (membrane-fusion protein)
MVQLSNLNSKMAIIAITVMFIAGSAKAQTEQSVQQAVQQSGQSVEQKQQAALKKQQAALQREQAALERQQVELQRKQVMLQQKQAALQRQQVALQRRQVAEQRQSTFLLLIENTENGIKLTNRQGCAFKELTFSLKAGQTQEIDQFGMRNMDDKVIKDANLASFRFRITKLESEFPLAVALEGIEGTAWKKLSFSIPDNSQLIDQNGMLSETPEK